MKIQIGKTNKVYPVFAEVDFGGVFIPLFDRSIVCMKGKVDASGKTKAINLATGKIFDMELTDGVIPVPDATVIANIPR